MIVSAAADIPARCSAWRLQNDVNGQCDKLVTDGGHQLTEGKIFVKVDST